MFWGFLQKLFTDLLFSWLVMQWSCSMLHLMQCCLSTNMFPTLSRPAPFTPRRCITSGHLLPSRQLKLLLSQSLELGLTTATVFCLVQQSIIWTNHSFAEQLACVILRAPLSANATVLWQVLHWLSMRQRVVFKLMMLIFKAKKLGQPACNLLCEY